MEEFSKPELDASSFSKRFIPSALRTSHSRSHPSQCSSDYRSWQTSHANEPYVFSLFQANLKPNCSEQSECTAKSYQDHDADRQNHVRLSDSDTVLISSSPRESSSSKCSLFFDPKSKHHNHNHVYSEADTLVNSISDVHNDVNIVDNKSRSNCIENDDHDYNRLNEQQRMKDVEARCSSLHLSSAFGDMPRRCRRTTDFWRSLPLLPSPSFPNDKGLGYQASFVHPFRCQYRASSLPKLESLPVIEMIEEEEKTDEEKKGKCASSMQLDGTDIEQTQLHQHAKRLPDDNQQAPQNDSPQHHLYQTLSAEKRRYLLSRVQHLRAVRTKLNASGGFGIEDTRRRRHSECLGLDVIVEDRLWRDNAPTVARRFSCSPDVSHKSPSSFNDTD